MQGRDTYEYGASLPLGLTLEWCEELPDSIITWTIPYKQHSTDQQRASWFVDGSSKVNRQQPIWKAATLIKEGGLISMLLDMMPWFLQTHGEVANGLTILTGRRAMETALQKSLWEVVRCAMVESVNVHQE